MTHDQARIFVVDDDLDVRDSLEAVIASLGHVCHSFSNAESLLTTWQENKCDCLILDVDLPGMDGLELLEKLREKGLAKPVAIYSGDIDKRVITAAERLGGIPVLQKSGDPGNVVDYLKGALSV